MGAKSRYANLLIDTVSRLSATETAEDRWQTICDIAGGIGAVSTNACCFTVATRQTDWMALQMNEGWQDEYMGDRLYEVDPLLSTILAGRVNHSLPTTGHHPVGGLDRQSRQYDAGMLRCGYRYSVCMGKRSGDQQIVLEMLTERDPEGLFGSGTTQAFRAVHAVLLGFLEQPCSPFCYPISSAPDVGLMGPERDVLALMAHGHTINEIAERLGTNEETVRVFLNQSAIKMGVTSGDEALATALARGFLSL